MHAAQCVIAIIINTSFYSYSIYISCINDFAQIIITPFQFLKLLLGNIIIYI